MKQENPGGAWDHLVGKWGRGSFHLCELNPVPILHYMINSAVMVSVYSAMNVAIGSFSALWICLICSGVAFFSTFLMRL